MFDPRLSSLTPIRLVPTDAFDCTGRSSNTSSRIRLQHNPQALICGLAAIGFASLAVLIVVLPRLVESRGWIQLCCSLFIALAAIGLHQFLQATVFHEVDCDQDDHVDSTILDLNKLERLK